MIDHDKLLDFSDVLDVINTRYNRGEIDDEQAAIVYKTEQRLRTFAYAIRHTVRTRGLRKADLRALKNEFFLATDDTTFYDHVSDCVKKQYLRVLQDTSVDKIWVAP